MTGVDVPTCAIIRCAHCRAAGIRPVVPDPMAPAGYRADASGPNDPAFHCCEHPAPAVMSVLTEPAPTPASAPMPVRPA